MAEALGLKAYIAKGLKGNAEINYATGEVAIDYDFEREVGTGANKQKVSIVFHAAHEMALHRVVELAPEEGRAFVYEMYKHLAGNEPAQFTLADEKRKSYAKQGVEISLAKAMEEISANNILYLYNNDEAKFLQVIDSIINGKNEKAKQGLRKYIDYLNNIIKKIRDFLTGKSAEERAKYQAELDEITKLRDMFETAFAKAVENRKAAQTKQTSDTKSTNNIENNTNQEYNGDRSHSLKSKYNEYNTIGMQWAYNSSTQIGDREVLYNPYTKRYVLVEATKEDVGFIELKTGNYSQLREDVEIYESKKQRDTDRKVHSFGNGQNNNARNNVNAGNRGAGKQNAEVSAGKSNSNKTTDTQTPDGNLIKEQSPKNYSLKNTSQISRQDVEDVQSIGRKSVNDFSKDDIKKTEAFARKYYQEMGEKSPFFRAWFGDWRANDNSVITVATAKNATRGNVINKDTGWDIQVSGKVFNETKKHNSKQSKQAVPYLEYINSIVENAILLDSYTIPKQNTKSENSVMMHSLYAVADIGNGKQVLKLFVEELNDVNSDGTLKRSYKLILPAASARVQGNPLSSVTSTASNINSVADLFNFVKQNDKEFNPKPASVVVNRDGTPKVVYHGSGENFTAFDITKSRSWAGAPDYDLPGFYFAENKKDATSYGDVKEYYINISNPYEGDIYSLAKEKGSWRNAYEYLVKEGYDGVIVDEFGEGSYEYIVLKAENIKSATDNIGTFDKSNTNVNFSLKGNEKNQYTEKEYRDFGWARANDILNEGQNADYRSKFADAKVGRAKFNKSKNGEYIIPVSDIYDSSAEGINNVLVYAKGTIDKPVITSIIEIYEYDETELDKVRRNIYELERRGIQQKTGDAIGRYYASDFAAQHNKEYFESRGYNNGDRYGGRNSGEASSTERGTKVDYSLKGTNDINTKDRKELLDIIEHLKGEFEITKFAKADPKKLAKMTRDILKEYSSKAEYDDTYKAIDELYQYMANGEDGHPAVWEDVYNRAYTIAQGIVENALVKDDYMYQEYKHLRDYLRSTPMKFNAEYDSVPSSYENFNEFRKLNMGRLKFSKDGMSIDRVYQELSNLYPEFFNEDEQTNSADQLERILDVFDEIQPTEINPFDRQIEQVSMHLANDITSRFFDVPQSKPTFADKAERRVVQERIKGGKKVETVRQQKDEKIKKLIESQREKTKKQLDKIREQRDKRVAKEQEKRRAAISKMSENQKAKVLRAQIMRHTSDLSKKLLNPTDNQHIPHQLQGAVATLLECINLESNYTYDTASHSYKKNDEGLPSKRTKAFEALRKLYEDVASSVVVDPDLIGEGGLLSDVIMLADKRIVDMNSTELNTVWQAIRAIEASVSTANKMFSKGKFETILEFAEALRADNREAKEKVSLKGVAGKTKNLVMLNMLTPETYFHYLGSAGDSIFRMMRDAQDKHISIMKEVADFTHKALKDVNVNSLEKTVHTVKLGGEDVQLSTAQLMELYVLMKREQAVEHILLGGILPDDIKTKGVKDITRAEPVRNISVAEISAATSELTDEQRKIADELQKFVSNELSAYGNEASMKVYNYEKFLEKNYWTIRTNKQEIKSDVGKDTAVTSVANKGMAKGTVPHANTSVRIGSIFDTFSAHSSDMATYAAWLGTSEDVNRIRNFVFWEDGARTGTVKGILDTVHGKTGSQYLEKLLADIAIGVKGTDNMNPFDKLIGHYKAAAVGANLRVIIQQPTAILRALDMIDARYLAEGVVSPLKGWEKAKKYAPIAQWKDWGYFDINTGRQMKDVLFDNASLLEKTKQVGMWGASMADSLAWGQMWNAVEAETKAKHKELEVSSDAYYEAVTKRFTEIVDHTQVVDGILQRSGIMRESGALTKMATSFMGEPTKQYNMALAAMHDAKNSKGDARKKTVGRLGRTAMSLAVAGIINACAQSIIDAMRDDDKEKDYWEKWLASFGANAKDVVNPLGYVPFAKDILSILQGYDVKRMDTEAITKTYNAAKNMYKAITGEGKYTIAEASAALFAEAARLFGIPVANVKRDIKSLVMSVAIGTDSYLMQYRIEKAMLDINYAGNSKNFMDILFNAYNNDKKAYEIIYNDLAGIYKADFLKQGVELTEDDIRRGRTESIVAQEKAENKIRSAMETRMMKSAGVEKTADLEKRYMTPDVEKKYDSGLNKVKSSQVWESANEEQRKEAEADLYSFLTSTSEDMEKMRVEAGEYDVDETEYILWQLAIEMADQPKGEKGSGSYDYKEKAEAINSLNLGDKEIAYFFGKGLNENSKEELDETLNAGIDIREYVNFKAATSDMKADKNAKGNSIPNSKKKKVVNYLNNANLTDEEWAYFYYEIMNYKK